VKASITESTFGSIYLRLAAIAIIVVVGFCGLAQFFIAPRLVNDRVQSAVSVIRSHETDIILHKTRAVRDELLKAGIISADQQFAHFTFDEKNEVVSKISGCKFISETVCLGNSSSVFFDSQSTSPMADGFRYAVIIRSDLARTPAILFLWEGIIAVFVASAFLLLQRSIQQKEKQLLVRLEVASSAFSRVKHLFKEFDFSKDEFEAFGRSAEDLVGIVEDYKSRFERKTRLEQLGQTVGQISHDLKAPLNEAENFLAALPLLMETSTSDELSNSIASLIKRIQSGKTALNQALQRTKQISVAREDLELDQVLRSVAERATVNNKLRRLSIKVQALPGLQIKGDQLRLETALLNLFENTADEKRDAQISVTLALADAGRAKVIYEDDGAGIPAEFLEKIFEPLITFKTTGTGLGLSSTREILAQHGGEIRALPNMCGAKFEILFPLLGGAHA
jgi:signal transduction histidine kinase